MNIICETLKEQTLAICIKGLIGLIRRIVKFRSPETSIETSNLRTMVKNYIQLLKKKKFGDN